MRVEKDYIGELEIEDSLLYGINTARALQNFGISRSGLDPYFIKAYILLKKACAVSNKEGNFLESSVADLIIRACDTLLKENDFSHFIVNPLSGGAGTSVNMNVNEVIANKALVLSGRKPGCYDFISPLDHVNMHQSTNDTYPTAFKASLMFYLKDLEKAAENFQNTLQKKELEFADVIKLGRTELMDALPVTVGMQFSAYSEAIGRDRWRIFKASERIKTVNIGGTAVGTGFNAPQKYIFSVIEKYREFTGLNIARSENLSDATQNLDAVVETMSIIKTLAVNLLKISGDLRLMASGPGGGLGEFVLPCVQEGSSIMPGKVNPVIPEYVTGLSIVVISNDTAITTAAASGSLELNHLYPVVSTLSLQNMKLMLDAITTLDQKCVTGLKLNRDRIKNNLSHSLAIVTYLSAHIGHDKASTLHKAAAGGSADIRQLCIDKGILTAEEYDAMVSPEKIRMLGFR